MCELEWNTASMTILLACGTDVSRLCSTWEEGIINTHCDDNQSTCC